MFVANFGSTPKRNASMPPLFQPVWSRCSSIPRCSRSFLPSVFMRTGGRVLVCPRVPRLVFGSRGCRVRFNGSKHHQTSAIAWRCCPTWFIYHPTMPRDRVRLQPPRNVAGQLLSGLDIRSDKSCGLQPSQEIHQQLLLLDGHLWPLGLELGVPGLDLIRS